MANVTLFSPVNFMFGLWDPYFDFAVIPEEMAEDVIRVSFSDPGSTRIDTYKGTGLVDSGGFMDPTGTIEKFIYRDGGDKVLKATDLNVNFGDFGTAFSLDPMAVNEVIFAANDTIIGSVGDDIMAGFGGEDIIKGKAGNDMLAGFEENDLIKGNDGDDMIMGGEGNDILEGGRNKDILGGDSGNDKLFGDQGKDVLIGGGFGLAPEIDKLMGGDGADAYILGNPFDVYYDGFGNNDFALVKGFTDRDVLVVNGDPSLYTYEAGTVSIGTSEKSGVLVSLGGELIALVKGPAATDLLTSTGQVVSADDFVLP